jgi:hypothetical protein
MLVLGRWRKIVNASIVKSCLRRSLKRHKLGRRE